MLAQHDYGHKSKASSFSPGSTGVTQTSNLIRRWRQIRNAEKSALRPRRCVSHRVILPFVLVELHFEGSLDFLVERLIVFQHFFGGIAALRQLGALVVQP